MNQVILKALKRTISSIPQKFGIPENFENKNEDTLWSYFCSFCKRTSASNCCKNSPVCKITNTKTTAGAGGAVPGFDGKNWSRIKEKM